MEKEIHKLTVFDIFKKFKNKDWTNFHIAAVAIFVARTKSKKTQERYESMMNHVAIGTPHQKGNLHVDSLQGHVYTSLRLLDPRETARAARKYFLAKLEYRNEFSDEQVQVLHRITASHKKSSNYPRMRYGDLKSLIELKCDVSVRDLEFFCVGSKLYDEEIQKVKESKEMPKKENQIIIKKSRKKLIDFSELDLKRLEYIKEVNELNSDAAAVRKSLRVMEWLIRKTEGGSRIVLLDEEGSIEGDNSMNRVELQFL